MNRAMASSDIFVGKDYISFSHDVCRCIYISWSIGKINAFRVIVYLQCFFLGGIT